MTLDKSALFEKTVSRNLTASDASKLLVANLPIVFVFFEVSSIFVVLHS